MGGTSEIIFEFIQYSNIYLLSATEGQTGNPGRFPFTKNFGKFPSGISVWEKRVPFVTSHLRSQALSVASLNLPRKFKMEANEAHLMLFLCEMLEVSIEEESLINSEDDAVDIFSAASTFMRRNLQRTEGYCEHALAGYSLDEFKGHLRITRGTMEGLCRVVQATGRVPQRHSFGTPPIPLQKQVLAFVWFISNSELSRSVSDRFNVTLSSLNRIIDRISRACVDLRQEYIKWPNSKLVQS